MHPNSLKCYNELQEAKILGKRQLEVFKQILETPDRTDREITELLNEEDPNYARPRRRDLEKLGIIEASGDRICTVSHKTATTWRKKNYDLDKVKIQKDKLNQKTSLYWANKIVETEKELIRHKVKYFNAMAREQKQTTLGEY